MNNISLGNRTYNISLDSSEFNISLHFLLILSSITLDLNGMYRQERFKPSGNRQNISSKTDENKNLSKTDKNTAYGHNKSSFNFF